MVKTITQTVYIVMEAAMQVPSSESASFTRVVIGQLKSDILRQISEDLRGQKLCRALAHLYHYYLHGEEGSRVAGGQPGSTQLTGESCSPSSALQLDSMR